MKTFALPLVLFASACFAGEIVLKQAGTVKGTIISLDCVSDGGLICARDAGASGAISCNAATATEPGCITPNSQTLGGGTKSFSGPVSAPTVYAPVFDSADGGPVTFGATYAGAITLGRSGQTVTLPGTAVVDGNLFVAAELIGDGNVVFGAQGTIFGESAAATAVIDFASISAQTCTDNTVALGSSALCTIGDPVFCALPSTLEAGLSGSCYISAAHTAKVRLCNVTSGSIDPASHTYGARCFH